MMRDCICPSIPDSTKRYGHEKRMAGVRSVIRLVILRFAFRFLFYIPLLGFWLYFGLRSFAREHRFAESAGSMGSADSPDLPVIRLR